MLEKFREHSIWALALIVVLVSCVWCWRVEAQTLLGGTAASSAAADGGLVTHLLEVEAGPTRVIVIDPVQRVMAVYHIGRDTGEITPKSVRNMTWDLEMIEFNSDDPSPNDLEKAQQRLK